MLDYTVAEGGIQLLQNSVITRLLANKEKSSALNLEVLGYKQCANQVFGIFIHSLNKKNPYALIQFNLLTLI